MANTAILTEARPGPQAPTLRFTTQPLFPTTASSLAAISVKTTVLEMWGQRGGGQGTPTLDHPAGLKNDLELAAEERAHCGLGYWHVVSELL